MRCPSRRSLPSAESGNRSLLEAANGALVEQLPEGLPRGVETGEDAVVHIIRCSSSSGRAFLCYVAVVTHRQRII